MFNFHLFSRRWGDYLLANQTLYNVSLLVLFCTLFEGTISFLAPLIITGAGISPGMMGLIMSTSSITGLLFDFIVCHLFRKASFRQFYLLMFALAAIFSSLLWQSQTLVFYFLAIGIWGLYYVLYNMANFDFVGRYTDETKHSESFGFLRIFICLGYLIAPIIAGLLIDNGQIGLKPFLMAWFFLAVAFIFYLVLLANTRRLPKFKEEDERQYKVLSIFRELNLLKKIGFKVWPVLLIFLILNTIDSTFWTIGPLLSESLFGLSGLGSAFMVAYLIPPLIGGWIVGRFAHRFGQKRTSLWFLFAGTLLMAGFFLIKDNYLLLLADFIAAFCLSIAWPAGSGAYSDYIAEAPNIKKEIEGLADSALN
ncbi:MAG: MFS transporter, partial [Candidatus Paceibacterota bacterium]